MRANREMRQVDSILDFIYSLSDKVSESLHQTNTSFENGVFKLTYENNVSMNHDSNTIKERFDFAYKPKDFKVSGTLIGDKWNIKMDNNTLNLFDVYCHCIMSILPRP